MSINLGTEAVTAIGELRGNRHFETFIAELGRVAQLKMLASIASDPERRVHETSYVRGMYDLWVALHAVHSGTHISQVKPPAMQPPEPEPPAAPSRGNRERVNA